MLRMWLLCDRSWPFATPPSQIRPRDLALIEARMLALLPDAPEPGGADF